MQSDPLGLEFGWNTYGYAGANSLSYSDPYGLDILYLTPTYKTLLHPDKALTMLLISTACADAHGLLTEGLSPGRISRLYGQPLSVYGLLYGRGLVSDDTEHAAMTAMAFAQSGGDPAKFESLLSGHMKRWLWALPPATGLATLRALVKLSIGVSPSKSGVYSAGNGPCMRAPILGALARNEGHLFDLVQRSSRMTHSDPKAIDGAFAVALWTHTFKNKGLAPDLDAFISSLEDRFSPNSAITAILRQVEASLANGFTPAEFCNAQEWKKGPSGYVVHTLGAVFSCLYSYNQEWERTIREAVLLGGDTDTVAAILGGMLGAVSPAPAEWITGLGDWPRNAPWLNEVEAAARDAAETGSPQLVPRLPWIYTLIRNMLFLPLILYYGIRRTLPPY